MPRQSAVSVFLLLLGLAAPVSLVAQDEPLLDELSQAFQQRWLRLGLLLQLTGDFQVDRPGGGNGFDVANARLRVSGELDRGFSYLLQANFAGAASILDARVSWTANRAMTASIGRYKAPFSGEQLTSAASVDFVNRSFAVAALAPGRQIGVQLHTGLDEALTLTAGAFNGTGGTNENNHLLYAARLAWSDPNAVTGPQPEGFAAGLNAAVSEDNGLPIPGVTPSFSGTRLLAGADARYASGRLLLAGELLYAHLDAGLAERAPWGFHATGGWMVTQRAQLLGRFERFDADPGTRDRLVFGFNVWPTTATEAQVNWIVDPDDADPDRHRLLVNVQLGF